MKRIHRLLAAFAVTLFAFMLAGCSEENKDSLSRVKEAGEISFAMSGGYPPFNFYNDNNELVGFDVDVANEVAKRLEVSFKPVTTEWSGIIEGLRSGAYDGILGSMAVTEQRLEVVNFSSPYYYSGAQLVVKKGTQFTAPAQLKGKTVGVVTGTTFAKDAEKLGAGDVKLYKDDTHTLTELNSGVVDGVITDRVVGVNAMNSGKFDIALLGMPLRGEDIAVAFRKGDDTLLTEVNKALAAMHKDGTLSSLSRKWLKTDITVR
ncbi:ABC transporter substrate-binding protein [uncultured Pseudodesulfovibrio sp.]|uniref:ABC transporter substrate-binding protein n=1 Tax=uncultured Pseudodesulfovibrio sp. TaxID=2035858 RepID=UPI00374899E6